MGLYINLGKSQDDRRKRNIWRHTPKVIAAYLWIVKLYTNYIFIFLILTQGYAFTYFRERGRVGGEREKNINVEEKHQSVASCVPQNQGWTHNLGMFPDQESNLQPFGVRRQCSSQLNHPSWAVFSFLNFSLLLEVSKLFIVGLYTKEKRLPSGKYINT